MIPFFLLLAWIILACVYLLSAGWLAEVAIRHAPYKIASYEQAVTEVRQLRRREKWHPAVVLNQALFVCVFWPYALPMWLYQRLYKKNGRARPSDPRGVL